MSLHFLWAIPIILLALWLVSILFRVGGRLVHLFLVIGLLFVIIDVVLKI